MSRISIVIPCFNEEDALPVYYHAMCRVMEEMSEEWNEAWTAAQEKYGITH